MALGRSEWRLSIISVLIALIATAALPVAGTHAADAAACVDGIRLYRPISAITPEAVVATGPASVLMAGGSKVDNGRRVASIVRRSPEGTRRQASFPAGSDSGFMGLDGSKQHGYWAVGYVRTKSSVMPLAARRSAGQSSWTRVSVPKPAGAGGALSDVALGRKGKAWAVGHRVGKPGKRQPWVIAREGGRWVDKSPKLQWAERGMLAGVSSTSSGGTWIAGWTSRFASSRPYLAKRVSGGWRRMTLPPMGDGALADVMVRSGTSGWAVGYRYVSGRMKPLVLRWNGSSWRVKAGPVASDKTAFLTNLSVSGGVLTVTGSVWSEDRRRFMALVAQLDGGTWQTSVLRTVSRDTTIPAVSGHPMDDGWAAGSDANSNGFLVRTCAGGASTATRTAVRQERRAAALAAESHDHESAHAIEPSPSDADADGARSVQTAATVNFRAVDRTTKAGLPTSRFTWGAVVADFDKDGRDDIFLGEHGKGTLFLDDGVAYRDAGVDFGKGDRHGCAASDVDGSGLPDLYCSFGAARGTGVKSNQLWLDPGGGSPRLARDAGGAPEALGRGRKVLFIDANDDGRLDLFLGQKPGRVDGQPSPNRVYLRSGPARFQAMGNSGVHIDLGAHRLDKGDVDRDGRQDLLLTYYDPRAASPRAGTRLYRNTGSGFRDVTSKYGVRQLGQWDAELVRLDGDKRPDLVQLTPGRIRISLQRNGKFVKVFERKIANGVAFATGDVDADGDKDIYVLRQKNSSTMKDLLLVNQSKGTSYKSVRMPSRRGGVADSVYPIDHDQNGRMDFLALNGRGTSRGPVQLIAFYRK